MNPPRYNVTDQVQHNTDGRIGKIVMRQRLEDTYLYRVAFGANRVSLTVCLEAQLEPVELGWTKPGSSL